jgi:Raf kinase inhibitor-like YbhB/YbcL family protein
MYNSQPGGMPRLLSRRTGPARAVALAILLLAACGFGIARPAQAATFSVSSPTVRNTGTMPPLQIANRNGCSGANQSPPIAWTHPPADTAAFAVTMADLDAKVGVLWHWVMFDIPAKTTALEQNADFDPTLRPAGARQARNSFDLLGYSGPCPPHGSVPHHYLITVWALNQADLPFKDGSPAEAVAVYLRRHAIGHASLTPHYSRH